MHDIEPHHLWRDNYISAEDERSPHFGRVYDEFKFTQKVYNYFIHPQWDEFGSSTLYGKILFADYDEGFAFIELIGEWNDCITNDVLFLKQNIIDELVRHGIHRHILVLDHVLNFHGSDNSYYEEWYEDIAENQGYICFINGLDHVIEEMKGSQIDHYANFSNDLQIPNWRSYKPKSLVAKIEMILHSQTIRLH